MKKSKGNVWKIIAICSIIIFSAVILLAAVRIVHFKSHFAPPFEASKEQKELVLSVVDKISGSEGWSLKNYTIKVENIIGEMNIDSQQHRVLMVTLEKENEIKSYLIDIDSKEVVQFSQTRYSGWMAGKQRFLPCEGSLPPEGMGGRWFHNALIGSKREPR